MRLRSSYFVLAISALAIFGMAGAASATFIDHFDGTALDTGVWNSTQYTATYTTTVAGSMLTQVAAGHSSAGELMTKDTSAVVQGDTMYFKLGAAPILNAANAMVVFGGWDPTTTGNPHIQIGNWAAGWNVEISDGTTTHNTAISAPAAADLYSVAWTSGSVVVSRNGSPLVTDTTAVPGSGVSMFVDAFVANGTTQYDFIGVNLPEPSVLVLALTGVLGLLAYAWRKRK
jgi:hypothetical protein